MDVVTVSTRESLAEKSFVLILYKRIEWARAHSTHCQHTVCLCIVQCIYDDCDADVTTDEWIKNPSFALCASQHSAALWQPSRSATMSFLVFCSQMDFCRRRRCELLTWITIIVIVLYTCINMRQLFDWLATIQKKLYQHVNGAAIVAWNLNVSNLNDFNEKTFEDETQRWGFQICTYYPYDILRFFSFFFWKYRNQHQGSVVPCW